MRRWTDGKNWLASKIKGPFLIYYELDEDRKKLKDGLIKQSFTLTTKQNEKFHLVCYYCAKERADGVIQGKIPSKDPKLQSLQFDTNVYLSGILQFVPTGFARETHLQPNPHYSGTVQYAISPPMLSLHYPNTQQAFEQPIPHNYYGQHQFVASPFIQVPRAPGMPTYQIQQQAHYAQQQQLQQPLQQSFQQPLQHRIQQPLQQSPPQQLYPQQHASMYVPRYVHVPYETIPMKSWVASPAAEYMTYNSTYPATNALPAISTAPAAATVYAQLPKQASLGFTYTASPTVSAAVLLPLNPDWRLTSILKETAQTTTLPSILPHITASKRAPLTGVQSAVDESAQIK